MWPLPQIKNEYIHLVLHSDRAVCVRFAHEKSYVRIQDYRVYHIPIGNAGILYNVTALQEALFDFIATFKLYAAYLNIVLGADLLTERLIVHAKSDASLEELIHERTVHTLYHAEHIGPHEEGFLFYVYGISQPLRLQLALLHHQLPVHMHQVISPWHAQAKVYKYITASVFSQARLVQDIDILHVQIPAVFSSEIFRRLVKTNPGVVYEHSDIVHAWGSFLGVQ